VNSQQPTNPLQRMIILSRTGSEVLMVRDQRGDYVLPCIQVNANQRLAEQLNRKLQDSLSVSACCLFRLAGEAAGDFEVLEYISHAAVHPLSTWLRVDSLGEQCLAKEEERLTITSAMREFQARTHGLQDEPFARPGWMADLFNWARAQLPRELHLTGGFQQLNAEPTFALVRLETNGPAVWFKAVGEPNLREYSITLALSRLFPVSVPELIAVRPEWHGWLTKEAEGQQLGESSELQWASVADALAELQTLSTGKIEPLLKAGCRDLRCEPLLNLVDPFMNRMTELMAEQRKSPPAQLTKPELHNLAGQLKVATEEWANLQVPDSIGHLDFNPENLLVSEHRCTFLDWAEAYVGPPFLTFEYLRGCASRLAQHAEDLDHKLANSYFGCWRQYVSAQALPRAQELAPLLAVFAYAAGTEMWRDGARIVERGLSGYFRSLTRRMYRESQALAASTTNSALSTMA